MKKKRCEKMRRNAGEKKKQALGRGCEEKRQKKKLQRGDCGSAKEKKTQTKDIL